MIAPNHVRDESKSKTPKVSNPSTKPTSGKKKSMEASTGLLLRLSSFENLTGSRLKYEKENFNPR